MKYSCEKANASEYVIVMRNENNIVVGIFPMLFRETIINSPELFRIIEDYKGSVREILKEVSSTYYGFFFDSKENCQKAVDYIESLEVMERLLESNRPYAED